MNLILRCKSVERWSKQFDNEAELRDLYESLQSTKTQYPVEMKGYQLPLGVIEARRFDINILNAPLRELHSKLAIEVITSAWRFNRLCVKFECQHTLNIKTVKVLRQWIGTPVYMPLERPGIFKNEKVDGFLCGVVPTLFDELWLVFRAITTSAQSIDFTININTPYFEFDNTKQFMNKIKIDQCLSDSECGLLYPIIRSLLTKTDKITLWQRHQLRISDESLKNGFDEQKYKKLYYSDIDECPDCFEDIADVETEINYPPATLFPVDQLVFNADIINNIETWVRKNNIFEEPELNIPLTQLQWTTLSATLIGRMISLHAITNKEEILRLIGLHMYCLGALRTYDGVPVDIFMKMYTFYRGHENWLITHCHNEYKEYINFAQNKMLKYYREKGN